MGGAGERARRRLVVIGGDAAGMSAAAAARRADAELEIVVLERGMDVSYAACGLPYWFSGEVDGLDELVAHDAEYFRHRRDIDVRLGAEAVAVDPEARRVRIADGADVPYDALVVATGARPLRPPVPGVELDGVMVLRDLATARALAERLAAWEAPEVLVVGTGAVGLEMAEALCARGARVVAIERAPRPVPGLPEEVAVPVADALASHCVGVRAGARLERIARDGPRLVATIDGRMSRHDLVLLGTGIAPNAELAAAAGCATGERGAVRVDAAARTSVAGIWAAGDCATVPHRVLGRDVWRPLATVANRQGRVAGRSAGGEPARLAGALGSWLSRFDQVGFGSTGIDVAEAAEAGFRPVATCRESRDRSGYIPGARSVRVRVVHDERTGRLLGAQAAGEGEVASRLHALSVAVWAGMDVHDLAECDLAYVPPLSPLRDPIELAAAAAVGDAP